jgi:hypothetical protein
MFSSLRIIFRGSLAICLWLVALEVTGQSNNPYIPNVVPASPDAAVLMKFGDVPVSPYTGTADVNVPIYNIQIKGLSLPIGLDYHTGGVKVKEEATWVGLGWNLSPGGMISRTIMDHDDFGTASLPYFTNQVPQPDADMAATQPYPATGTPTLGSYMYDFFCTYLVGTSNGNYDYSNAFNQGVGMYDMEPDLFNYNIPGHSGKFILTRAGNVVLQKQENIRIQFPSNGSSFTITDDQGNKYYFGVHDQTPSPSNELSATVWYITKIVTQQNDSIVFNYTTGGYNIKAPLNQYYNTYCSASPGTVTTQGALTTYTCQTLNSIDFPTGHLTFQWDLNRSDMNGGAKLDSVLIYSKSPTGALSYQKQFNFNYSYFNATTPTPADSFELYRLRLDSVKEKTTTTSLPPYSFVYNNITSSFKCIKDSFDVDHWGYFNAAGNSSLIPTINAGYNPPGNSGVQSVFSYTGANREPNATYMGAFSLQQVNYPTGGKTVFNYQPNDYDYQNSQTGPTDFQYEKLVTVDSVINVVNHGTTSGTINLTDIQPIVSVGSGQINLNIFVTFRYQKNDTFPYSNTSHRLYFTFSGGNGNVNVLADINEATCSSPVCTVTVPVTVAPIGIYNWSAYIDASIDTVTTFSEIELNFQYSETQQDYDLLNNSSFISPASGLRIQSVLNYSDANTIASEKVYTYGYSADKLGTGTPQAYSYGRLMSFPSYVRYAIVPGSNGSHCDQLSLFSSSYTALSSVIQGNIVGYDQVTETSIDPSTGDDIGRTVYTYFNSPDSSVTYGGFRFPGCFGLGNSLTGILLSKVTYADNSGVYNKVEETDNFYHTTNRNVYFSPKYSFAQTQTPIGSYCSAGTAVSYEVMACFYPSIKSEKTLLDSTTEISYQQLDPTKAVAKTTAFYYDNPIHYQVTRSRTIDSKGNKLVDLSHYAQDYIPNGNTVTGNTILDSMIGRNMVSETIEKTDSLYYPGASSGSVTSAQLNLYRILPVQNNTIGADRIYKLDLPAPITNFQPFAISGNTTSMDSRYEQKISFDHYDPYSNITQYTPEDGVIVSFLWDYTGNYPIAKVTGSDTADIAYTSFEADGNGHWTIGSTTRASGGITGSSSYTLNSNLSKTGLNSSTGYTVSYWSNGGAYTIPGTASGYPIKGKVENIGGATWTYYEHLVTGQTTVQINGSGGIDELRLYPSGAQMTTFTYTPSLGITSQCDVASRVTYYEYDAFQRLADIKDQDQNILKRYCYNYNGETESCLLSQYATPAMPVMVSNSTNQGQTLVFTSSTGGTYTFTAGAGSLNAQIGSVPPGTYGLSITPSAPSSNYYISYTANSTAKVAYTAVSFSNYAISNTVTVNVTPVATQSLVVSNTTNRTITLSFVNSTGPFTYTANANTNGSVGYIPQGTYAVTLSPSNPSNTYPIVYSVDGIHQSAYGSVTYNTETINSQSTITVSPVASEAVVTLNNSNQAVNVVFTDLVFGGTYPFTVQPQTGNAVAGYIPASTFSVSYTFVSGSSNWVDTAILNGSSQTFNVNQNASWSSQALSSAVSVSIKTTPSQQVVISNSQNVSVLVAMQSTGSGGSSYATSWNVPSGTSNDLAGYVPNGVYNIQMTPYETTNMDPTLCTLDALQQLTDYEAYFNNFTINAQVSIHATPPPNVNIAATNTSLRTCTFQFTNTMTNVVYTYSAANGASGSVIGTVPQGTYNVLMTPQSPNSSQTIYWGCGSNAQNYYGAVSFGSVTVSGSSFSVSALKDW